MFREFLGLPSHPLLVHAAVILVPLLVIVAIVHAVVPRWRLRTDWAAVVLAITAPIATYVSKESGESLEHVLRDKNYPAAILEQVGEHSEYADTLFWCVGGLAVATLVLVWFTSGRRRRESTLPAFIQPILIGVVVILGILSAGYVYLTGHSGAEIVWQNILSTTRP